MLNTIDGVESKGTEIMGILTSNHVEKINRAMIRPGRLDAVIHIDPPDAASAEKLIRIYGRGTIDQDEDLSEVAATLAGHIPAAIREAVERAKLYAIASSQGRVTGIAAQDLLLSAKQMQQHLELLREPDNRPTPAERFMDSLRDMLSKATMPEELTEGVEEARGAAKAAATHAAATNRRAQAIERGVGNLSGTALSIHQKTEKIEHTTEQILSEVS